MSIQKVKLSMNIKVGAVFMEVDDEKGWEIRVDGIKNSILGILSLKSPSDV